MSRTPNGAIAHLLEVARLPASVERGLLGSVNAEIGEPALAGDGLDPLGFFAGRRGWAEVEFDCAAARTEPVDFGFDLEQRAQRRLALAGVNFGAGVWVVDSHRPEQARRHWMRHCQLVGLAAVEIGAAN